MSNENKLASKATPAPWIKERTISNPMRNHFRTVIHSETGYDGGKHYRTIADIFGESEQECRDNMNLITAAPEMLSLLCDIREWIDNHEEWWMSSANKGGFDIERIEEVIKKAYNF